MSISDKTTKSIVPLRVPDTLYDLLMDLMINYNSTKQKGFGPENTKAFTTFAVKYFTKVKELSLDLKMEEEESSIEEEEVSSEESISLYSSHTRHKSVRPIFKEELLVPKSFTPPPLFIPKTNRIRFFLMKTLREYFLFKSLERRVLYDLVSCMEEECVSGGVLLTRQGTVLDKLYVVEKGELQTFYPPTEELTEAYLRFSKGSMFGELSLLHVVYNEWSIQAITNSRLWSLSRATYKQLIMENDAKAIDIKRKLLTGVPCLKNLRRREICKLADSLRPRTFNKGSWVFHEKEFADGMYIVEKGMILLTVNTSYEDNVLIGRVIDGQSFGEAALISFAPRVYSAIATRKTRAYYVDTDDFERLVGSCLDILHRTYDYDQVITKMFGAKGLITKLRNEPKPSEPELTPSFLRTIMH